MGIGGLGCWALVKGWFLWMLAGETVFVAAMYLVLHRIIARKPWLEE